jgi:hypothetical protein
MTPAEMLKDILVTAGIGTFGGSTGWGIYVSKEPDNLDTVITLYDSGGEDPNPKWLLNYPSVQIMIRGTENGYQAMFTKAQAVVDALLGYPSTDFADQRLVSTRQIGGLGFLGYDEKKRPRITTNWSLITEPNTGVYREPL